MATSQQLSINDAPETEMCGARVRAGGVSFRVWAPRASKVEVILNEQGSEPISMSKGEEGVFTVDVDDVGAGALYRYRLDGRPPMPDPCSRYQPQGVHGPSMVVDPHTYQWKDTGWQGVGTSSQVFYELHIGAFTREGTYSAAAGHLEYLRDLGITCIELMPLAEFAGQRGWGYDAVALFAPYHPYGTPDELRAFVDRAHSVGIGVILDVVYNHVGAEGNYLPDFSPDYFTDRHANEWGQTVNYYCDAVRDFVVHNAAYWIREFHFDGLRLDAIQSIFDPSSPALLARISRTTRATAHPRSIVIAAEDYRQRAELLKPSTEGGAGLDFLWNDDFHHAARVAMTGSRGGYFGNYHGSAQELLSTLRRGFLFQGQYDAWTKAARGSPTLGIPAHRFIAFLQNHDQIANTLYGARLQHLTSPGRARAALAALLLGPQTPLLFMGEEFAASTPFAYFADYKSPVAESLWAGRRRELSSVEQYSGELAQARVCDPSDEATFLQSKLDWQERDRNTATHRLYKALLAIRRDDEVLGLKAQGLCEGAVLGPRAFALRWFDRDQGDRLLVVNLGQEISRGPIAEPLLAPPTGRRWELRWSSDDPRFGGLGVVAPETKEGWCLAAESASFLRAVDA